MCLGWEALHLWDCYNPTRRIRKFYFSGIKKKVLDDEQQQEEGDRSVCHEALCCINCNTITANSSSLLICTLSSNNQIIYSAMDSAILLPLIIKTQWLARMTIGWRQSSGNMQWCLHSMGLPSTLQRSKINAWWTHCAALHHMTSCPQSQLQHNLRDDASSRKNP